MGHALTDLGGDYRGSFVVDLTIASGKVKFAIVDESNKLTTSREIRAVLGKAVDTWIASNRSQLATNGVTVGNGATDTFGGSDLIRPSGEGFKNLDWNFDEKWVRTPSITTTSLSSADITVSAPFASVI